MELDLTDARKPRVRTFEGQQNIALESSLLTTIAGDGAVDISLGDWFKLTKGSAAAITLADPKFSDNGRYITILSGSAQAHTITVAGGIGGAGGTDDVITFTNRIAAAVTLMAVNGSWYVMGSYLAAIA